MTIYYEIADVRDQHQYGTHSDFLDDAARNEVNDITSDSGVNPDGDEEEDSTPVDVAGIIIS